MCNSPCAVSRNTWKLEQVGYEMCIFGLLLLSSPGAYRPTMMVVEQTQGYMISYELTKPNRSNQG